MMNRRMFLQGSIAASTLTSLSALAGWSTKASLPYVTQEIYPALHKGKIFVAGGLTLIDDKIDATPNVVAFDLKEECWQSQPSFSLPRHHGFLVSVDDTLYSISGFAKTSRGMWDASREVFALDESANQWLTVDCPLDQPLCETVGGNLNGNIHLVSGRSPIGDKNGAWRDHSDTNTHVMLNLQSMEWEKKRPAPSARNSAAGVIVGNDLHIVGGRTVNGGNVDTHEVYLAKDDKWESRAPMPQAQGGLAAARLNDSLIVFGGEYFNDGGGVYSEVWQYSLTQDKWRKIDEMPVPRHGLGAVAVDDSIYVIAGAAQAGGRETTDRLSVFRL